MSVLGGSQFTNSERVTAQSEAKQGGRALGVATGLIREKIENAIATLEGVIPRSPARELAVVKHHRDAKKLATKPPKSLAALLGIEGRTAQAYFAAWQSIPIQWKGLTRRAIPEDWHRVGQRQSLIGTRTKGRNRHASHPVNAMLNYAYAILESQVRMQIVAEGFDPTIGYLHTSTRTAGACAGPDGATEAACRSEGAGVRAGAHVSSDGFYDPERRRVQA
jgi:CRISPR-associated endonuclease Cas1